MRLPATLKLKPRAHRTSSMMSIVQSIPQNRRGFRRRVYETRGESAGKSANRGVFPSPDARSGIQTDAERNDSGPGDRRRNHHLRRVGVYPRCESGHSQKRQHAPTRVCHRHGDWTLVFMALLTSYPLALAPGMETDAFFAFSMDGGRARLRSAAISLHFAEHDPKFGAVFFIAQNE